ncbi:MAG: TlpA disulfide reductase family protein, partial [Steroidobacteraceae bacterium]
LLRSLLLALLFGTLIACDKSLAQGEWTGTWRAALQLPGGELPFGLEIARERGATVAWLVNSSERVKVTEVTIAGDDILLRMPGFENRITARRMGPQLRGELLMVKAGGKRQQIPFAAQRDQAPRFFADAANPGGDVSGRWAANFADDEGGTYIAVGEFRQQGSAVSGTFLTPTGDYRYLNGEMRNGKLYLGTFNGGRVFLFHASLDSSGSLPGEYWSGLAWHEKFTAHRDENASLGATTAVTAMKSSQALGFAFPDLAGNVVSLGDARFRGKVVVVTLAGSWCPNCHDEAAFLEPYFRAHQADGLEVVSLMFEQLETVEESRDAVQRFRDRYAITYPLLLAGTSDRVDAATKLPQLNGVYAYPTTILLDRKGHVRHIHTGFSGPATGQHYTDLTTDLDQRIRALLTENT